MDQRIHQIPWQHQYTSGPEDSSPWDTCIVIHEINSSLHNDNSKIPRDGLSSMSRQYTEYTLKAVHINALWKQKIEYTEQNN